MNGRPIVLVVDDEQGIRDSLKRMLERQQYSVLLAGNGKEGLDALRTEKVNVVLTDLRMPGMDGMDLLKAARTVAPETEVIMMTAYGTVDTVVNPVKLGAYTFIKKPFKIGEIRHTVQRALKESALADQQEYLKKNTERRLGFGETRH